MSMRLSKSLNFIEIYSFHFLIFRFFDFFLIYVGIGNIQCICAFHSAGKDAGIFKGKKAENVFGTFN